MHILPPSKMVVPEKCFEEDDAAKLSAQVASLQDSFVYNCPDGRPVKFECFLTASHNNGVSVMIMRHKKVAA